MKFLLIGLFFTFANAITHHSGYNYPQNNANTGFVPNIGPCCQEVTLLKQQLAAQQQQLLLLQQQQQQGRIVHKHESATSAINSVQDTSAISPPSKGYINQNHQGPVVGNAEFSGTKVYNYHSQGALGTQSGLIGGGHIHHVHHHHHPQSTSGQLTTGGSSSVSNTGSKGYNYQNQISAGNGQVVQGHLLVGGGNHAGPVNGPSAAQLIANKYSSHANSAYNGAATTVLRPPAPQGGFTVSQTVSGYNTNSNGNYNEASSHQQYATTTKLVNQGSSSNYAASTSGSGLSSISGLSSSAAGYNENYDGSASDKTYTQTRLSGHGSDYKIASTPAIGGQVEKHIYVHVPPEDFSDSAEERAKLQQLIQPKKHYKIIFIKAPTISSSPNYQQLLSQGGLSQEKTLVYVLVKKPEEPSAEEIAAIQNQSVKHNKPEVFFIKYKTRKEAEQAANALGHGHGPFIGNFVGTDLGVDIRNSGSTVHSHEGLASVASAIETAETYSKSSGSSSSSSGVINEVSSSYIPPSVSIPKPAPVYGVPSVKK